MLVVTGMVALLGAAAAPAASVGGGTHSAGNGIYKVFVAGTGDSNAGEFTAQTDTNHPQGPGLNILFGGGQPDTSYTTIHSFTSSTDYTNEGGSVGGSTNLGPFATVSTLGTTGFRTTYVLPGPATTPDKLTIVQDVNVGGADFNSSHIDVTTTVTNNGASPVAIGVRYLLDWQIGKDDGPTFQAQNPNGPVLTSEMQFAPPTFEFFRIEDNDVNDHPPTFDVLGTANGPSSLSPRPTPPTLLQYNGWSDSFSRPFAYTQSGGTVATSGATNDSASNVYWGDQSGNALTLGAGQSKTVSFSLFATAPGQTIPSDDTTPPTSHATVPQCSATGQIPVKVTDNSGGSGPKAVHFKVDGGSEQTVETDSGGNATITIPNGRHDLEYWGEDQTGNQESPHNFTTVTVDTAHQCQSPPPPGLPPPVAGVSVNVFPLAGIVYVQLPGRPRHRLVAGEHIPIGSLIDATDGRVEIEAAASGPGGNGATQSAIFSKGAFRLHQSSSNPLTEARLAGGNLGVCPIQPPSTSSARIAAVPRALAFLPTPVIASALVTFAIALGALALVIVAALVLGGAAFRAGVARAARRPTFMIALLFLLGGVAVAAGVVGNGGGAHKHRGQESLRLTPPSTTGPTAPSPQTGGAPPPGTSTTASPATPTAAPPTTTTPSVSPSTPAATPSTGTSTPRSSSPTPSSPTPSTPSGSRMLWAQTVGGGHWRTRGTWAAAEVRGTKWFTRDSCSGTLVLVVHGVVAVLDVGLNHTVTVNPGQSYFAHAR